MSSTIGRPRVRSSGTVTCPSACGPVTAIRQRSPSLRSFAITSRNSKPKTVARSRWTSTGPSQSIRRWPPMLVEPPAGLFESASHSPRSNCGQSPLTSKPVCAGSVTGCASKRAAPRSRRQAPSRAAKRSFARALPDSSVTSFTREPGISRRTRVGRVSGAALAKGRGAWMTSPPRLLATSKNSSQSPPARRFSMWPCSSQFVAPLIAMVAGRPMNAGSLAPPARPCAVSSTAASTSPEVRPGLAASSNGPSRIVPRSPAVFTS